MNDFSRQEATKDHYNNTQYYDNNLEEFSNLESPFQRYRLEKVFSIDKPKKGDAALDLGCGWGTFSFASAKIAKNVVGVDFSEKGIAMCNELKNKKRVKNVEFIKVDSSHTGLESESFDLILCADLVEHLYPEVYIKTLDECRRLLKKGGRLVIWTPCDNHFLEIMRKHNFIFKKDESHVDFKAKDQMKNDLLARGFQVEKDYYAESNWPILKLIERLFLKFVPLLRRRIAILAIKK